MTDLNLLEEATDALFRELGSTSSSLNKTTSVVTLGAPWQQTLTVTAWPSRSKSAALIAKEVNKYDAGTVLVTDHLTEKKAKALREQGVEFFDMAGNAYLNRDGLHIWVIGKTYPFWQHLDAIDGRAAFERSGLKVTFSLITQATLVNRPYRQIAEASGAALGTVKRVMDSLQKVGNLQASASQRHLLIDEKFLDDWAQAYINRLMPKLELGEVTAGIGITDPALKALQGSACWGGESAAEHYTQYMKPKDRTLYLAKEAQSTVMNLFRLKRPSPFNEDTSGGVLHLRTQFWPQQSSADIYAHPLVVYADLLATPQARNAETAQVLYEKHLAPLCQ